MKNIFLGIFATTLLSGCGQLNCTSMRASVAEIDRVHVPFGAASLLTLDDETSLRVVNKDGSERPGTEVMEALGSVWVVEIARGPAGTSYARAIRSDRSNIAARFDAKGELDRTFGKKGVAEFPSEAAKGIAPADDGSLLAAQWVMEPLDPELQGKLRYRVVHVTQSGGRDGAFEGREFTSAPENALRLYMAGTDLIVEETDKSGVRSFQRLPATGGAPVAMGTLKDEIHLMGNRLVTATNQGDVGGEILLNPYAAIRVFTSTGATENSFGSAGWLKLPNFVVEAAVTYPGGMYLGGFESNGNLQVRSFDPAGKALANRTIPLQHSGRIRSIHRLNDGSAMVESLWNSGGCGYVPEREYASVDMR